MYPIKKARIKSFICRLLCAALIAAFLAQDLAMAAGERNPAPAAWSSVPAPRAVPSAIEIPADSGILRKRDWKDGEPVLINIQDAHQKLGAQESIARILTGLVAHYDLGLIALEGASGAVDTSLVSSFPDAGTKRITGEMLLREGRISAGEFYSILATEPVRLYGAEDGDLYRQNADTFGLIVERRPALLPALKRLRARLDALEAAIYSPELRELSANRISRSGDFRFKEYWELYGRRGAEKNIDLAGFPNLATLKRTLALESGIDFDRASLEREALFRELAARLSSVEMDKLLRGSLEFKEGKITAGRFHSELAAAARKAGVASAGYSNLIRYARYAGQYENVDLADLFDEAERFEAAVRESWAASDAEKRLGALSDRIRILLKFLSVTLSSREYARVAEDPATFSAASVYGDMVEFAASRGETESFSALDAASLAAAGDEALAFYQKAEARNRALFDHTLERMRRDDVRVAALVTGGFHSEGISELVSAQKLSQLIVMPKFDAGSADRPYVTVLTQKPKEYEEAFRDSDFYLAASAFFTANNLTPENLRVVVAAMAAARRLSGGAWDEATIASHLANLEKTRDADTVVEPGSLATLLGSVTRVQPAADGTRYEVTLAGARYSVPVDTIEKRITGMPEYLGPASDEPVAAARVAAPVSAPALGAAVPADPAKMARRISEEARNLVRRNPNFDAKLWLESDASFELVSRRMGATASGPEERAAIRQAAIEDYRREPAFAPVAEKPAARPVKMKPVAPKPTPVKPAPVAEETLVPQPAPVSAVSQAVRRALPDAAAVALAFLLGGLDSLGPGGILLSSLLFRASFAAASLVHGLGHAAERYALTGKLSAFSPRAILEGVPASNFAESLLPLGLLPQLGDRARPAIELSDEESSYARSIAFGALFANAITSLIPASLLGSGLLPPQIEYAAAAFSSVSILTLASVPDWRALITGLGYSLACGPNFVVRPRDRSSRPNEIISGKLRDYQTILNREAKTRGSQSAGFAALAQDKRTGDVVIVYDKVLNGKRTDIVEVLDEQTQTVLRESVAQGLIALEEWEVLINHLRYATGGATNWDNAQPHWYEDPARRTVFRLAPGNPASPELESRDMTVYNLIDHNGDCNYVEIELVIDGAKQRVTLPAKSDKRGAARHFFTRTMPKSSSRGNSDSRTIAEWTDFNLTQGQVFKSARRAYYTEVADLSDLFAGKDFVSEAITGGEPNRAATQSQIEAWSSKLEKIVVRVARSRGASFFLTNAKGLADAHPETKRVVQSEVEAAFAREFGEEPASRFAASFAASFFDHDLTWLMREAALSLKGTFAMNVLTTLEDRLGVYALTQSFSIGHNRTTGEVFGSAEPEGVTVSLAQSAPGDEIYQMFFEDGQYATVDFSARAEQQVRIYDRPVDRSHAYGRPEPRADENVDWFPIRNNPKIDLPSVREEPADVIEKDQSDIAFNRESVRKSFEPGGANRAARDHWVELMRTEELDWESDERALAEKHRDEHRERRPHQSTAWNVVFYGVDFNEDLAGEIASLAEEIMPGMNAAFMNSGELLKLMKRREKGLSVPQITANTIFVAVTNSAQTQSTNAVTRFARRMQKEGRVIAVTQKRFNALSQILGEDYRAGAPNLPTTFLNLSNHSADGTNGRRPNEAATLVVDATHAVLVEMLLALAESFAADALKRPSALRPFGLKTDVTPEKLAAYRVFQKRSHLAEVTSRTGYDTHGHRIDSPDVKAFETEAKYLAVNNTEWMHAYTVHQLVYGTLLSTFLGISVFSFFFSWVLGPYIVVALDAAFALTGVWLTTLIMRRASGRPVFDRQRPGAEVFIDRGWIARIHERLNATLLSNAPGFVSTYFYSADFIRDALHRFHMRSHRGTVTRHRIPDERFGVLAAEDAASADMVRAQIGGIRFNGGQPQAHVIVREGSAFTRSSAPGDTQPADVILSDHMADLRKKYDGKLGPTVLSLINRTLIDFTDGILPEQIIGHRRANIVARSVGSMYRSVLGERIGGALARAHGVDMIFKPGSTPNGALVQSTEHPVGTEYPNLATMRMEGEGILEPEEDPDEPHQIAEVGFLPDGRLRVYIDGERMDEYLFELTEVDGALVYETFDGRGEAGLVQTYDGLYFRVKLPGETLLFDPSDLDPGFVSHFRENATVSAAGARAAARYRYTLRFSATENVLPPRVMLSGNPFFDPADGMISQDEPAAYVSTETLADFAPAAVDSAGAEAYFSQLGREAEAAPVQVDLSRFFDAKDFTVSYDEITQQVTVAIDKETVERFLDAMRDKLGPQGFDSIKDKVFLEFSAAQNGPGGVARVSLGRVSLGELEEAVENQPGDKVKFVFDGAQVPEGTSVIEMALVSETPRVVPAGAVRITVGEIYNEPDPDDAEETTSHGSPNAAVGSSGGEAAPDSGSSSGSGGSSVQPGGGTIEEKKPEEPKMAEDDELFDEMAASSPVETVPVAAVSENLPEEDGESVPVVPPDAWGKSLLDYAMHVLQFVLVAVPFLALSYGLDWLRARAPAIWNRITAEISRLWSGLRGASRLPEASPRTPEPVAPQGSRAALLPSFVRRLAVIALLGALGFAYTAHESFKDRPFSDISMNPVKPAAPVAPAAGPAAAPAPAGWPISNQKYASAAAKEDRGAALVRLRKDPRVESALKKIELRQKEEMEIFMGAIAVRFKALSGTFRGNWIYEKRYKIGIMITEMQLREYDNAKRILDPEIRAKEAAQADERLLALYALVNDPEVERSNQNELIRFLAVHHASDPRLVTPLIDAYSRLDDAYPLVERQNAQILRVYLDRRAAILGALERVGEPARQPLIDFRKRELKHLSYSQTALDRFLFESFGVQFEPLYRPALPAVVPPIVNRVKFENEYPDNTHQRTELEELAALDTEPQPGKPVAGLGAEEYEREIKRVLSVSGSDDLDRLVTHPDWKYRANAAVAMAESGNPSYMPLLANMMRDSSAEVRRYAAWGVARFTPVNNENSIDPRIQEIVNVLNNYRNESDIQARGRAVLALSTLKNRQQAMFLLDLILSAGTSPGTSGENLTVVWRDADERKAVEKLKQTLSGRPEHPYVRMQALNALMALDEPESVDALLSYFEWLHREPSMWQKIMPWTDRGPESESAEDVLIHFAAKHRGNNAVLQSIGRRLREAYHERHSGYYLYELLPLLREADEKAYEEYTRVNRLHVYAMSLHQFWTKTWWIWAIGLGVLWSHRLLRNISKSAKENSANRKPQAAPAGRARRVRYTSSPNGNSAENNSGGDEAGARVALGVIVPAGEDARGFKTDFLRRLEDLLPGSGARFAVVFTPSLPGSAQAAVRLRAKGASLVLDETSLESPEAALRLARALAQSDAETFAALNPFVRHLVNPGSAPSLSSAERLALAALIEESLPDAAPSDLRLASSGAYFVPAVVRPAQRASALRAAGELDRAVSLSLIDGAPIDSGVAATVLRHLAPRRGMAHAIAQADLLAGALLSAHRTRLVLSDPSQSVDLSALANAPRRTIVTDLEVFLKDGEGLPYALRMRRLDKKAPKAFRQTLLVRDARWTSRETLESRYPAVAAFNGDILFRPGLADASDLRGDLRAGIDKDFLVLAPRPGSISLSKKIADGRALVLSLDRGAQTTVQFLETGALLLAGFKTASKNLKRLADGSWIFLPAAAPLGYLLELARLGKEVDVAL